MFQDVCVETIDFESTWRQVRQTEESECQTEDITKGEGEAQTVVSLFQTRETASEETMTLTLPPFLEGARRKGEQWVFGEEAESPKKGGGGDDDDIIDESFIDSDMLQFLEAIGPDMLAQLDMNTKTSAFDGYSVGWEDSAHEVTCRHVLTPNTVGDDMHAVDLCWNSNGSILAAAFGRIDVVGWCYQRGYVCTWNVFRADLNATKPDLTLEGDNYVTAIAFHPEEPAFLCGGTYNGEVLLWDITKEDALVCQSNTSLSHTAAGHTDPIQQIMWCINKKEPKTKYLIVTVSGDGKILLWMLSTQMATQPWVAPVAGYEVSARQAGQQQGLLCVGILQNQHAGLSVKSGIPTLENALLVGTEVGSVCRTGIRPVTFPDGKQQPNPQLRFTDPVVYQYEQHKGPTQALSCSPFHRNLFLTASSDGSVRFFNIHETNHLHSVIPSASVNGYLYDAKFSPVRPFVFGCVSKDSHLYLYDLEESRIKPAAVLMAGSEGQAVLSLAFNGAEREWLATGDAKGHVRVWHLSRQLSTPTAHESALLNTKDSEAKNDFWFKYAGLVL